MRESNLYFNNIYCNDLDVLVGEYPSIPYINEEYEEVQVEGRNGSLFINKGYYKDRKISFKFKVIKALDNYHEKTDRVMNWLTSIEDNRLVFDREDRCFIVKKILMGNIAKSIRLYGEFTVDFILEPFMADLKPTTVTVANSGYNIKYSGSASADTLIKVYGNGNIQVTINNETMTITNVIDYIEIDSYLMQVRNADGTNHSALGNYSMLEYGNNTISYDGNITKIEITYTTKYR